VPTSTERVDVSVLVPVRNEADALPEVLEAMRSQDFGGTIEFVFIDGQSEDGSRELLERAAAADPRVRVLDNPARTTPHALNIGLRESSGAVVARMDAHTRYPPNYLADGVARLRRGDVTWVSGPALAEGDGRWSRRVALALSMRLGVGGADFRTTADQEFEVDTGFAGLWLRETLERYGGWDEEWINDQDFELAARIRADGGRVLCLPQLAASYIPRDSLPALARQYHVGGFYRVKTSLRHPASMRRSHLLPPALLVGAGLAVAGPRPLRRLGRAGLALYAGALAHAALTAARRAEPGDAVAVPAALATMHAAWGAGFLRGCVELGFPGPAVERVLRSLIPGERGAS
jgi:succinoglycan biosynthesis protein ExoA